MRIAAAVAYLIGGVPLLLTVWAAHGTIAVLGGLVVSTTLWIGIRSTARHHRSIRMGRWLVDGILLGVVIAVAASPLGDWLTGGWLAVPFLHRYAGAALIVLSLTAWVLRSRRPGWLPTRALNGIDYLFLRDGLLAAMLAGVFASGSAQTTALAPAALGLASAQLVPPLKALITGGHHRVWSLDVTMLMSQQPQIRLGLWLLWARDALVAPRRPDDSLLRVMVTQALTGVAGNPATPVPIPGIATPDDGFAVDELLDMVIEGLYVVETYVLPTLTEPRRGAVADRVTSIRAYAQTAHAQLAIHRGQHEEAAALLADSATRFQTLGLPNLYAFAQLSQALGDADPESSYAEAIRIAEDESLSAVIRRLALFSAAYQASFDDDKQELAAALYQRADAVRPTRRDRAVILAEAGRDLGRRLFPWQYAGATESLRLVETNTAGLARQHIYGVPFLQNLGDTGVLQTSLDLGRHAVQAGLYAEAAEILSGVAKEAEGREQPFTLLNACYWLALAQKGLDQPAEAYASLRTAVGGYDRYRGGLLDPSTADELGALTMAHLQALSLLAEHPEITEQPAIAGFELAEQARARGMSELLGSEARPPSGDDELTEREKQADMNHGVASMLLDMYEGEQRVWALRQLRSERAALHQVWQEMIAAGGEAAEYAQLRSATPITYPAAQQLLATMSDPPAVVFEYHMTGEADMVLFVARADLPEPVMVHLPYEHAAIYRAVRDADWSGDLDGIDAVLEPFLAPVLEWSQPGEVLCFSPFSSMHRVPLHAMTVGGAPLIERNPVCYVPSLTVLRHCQAKRTGRRERALLLADSSTDAPLPHARVQAAEIQTLLPDGAAPTRIGADASADALHEGLIGADSVDLLHLACHGEFDTDDPLQSGIVLSGGERLTVAELMGLTMRADLVTFSACQSGISENEAGEELIGLARAAMFAGTPSVLATLWSVDEIATSVLMSEFYRRLLDGASKVAALREAQLATRAMTGTAVIAYCGQAMTHVAPAEQWLLRQDIADVRFRCRDFAAALAAYQELAEAPEVPGGEPTRAALRLAQTRCRRALRSPGEIEYGVRPFAHPYFWAPFVLIGDWR
ncbi:MAG: CHAT domain-containing protein [Micromonosporaceae bacterium]